MKYLAVINNWVGAHAPSCPGLLGVRRGGGGGGGGSVSCMHGQTPIDEGQAVLFFSAQIGEEGIILPSLQCGPSLEMWPFVQALGV